MIKGNYEKLK